MFVGLKNFWKTKKKEQNEHKIHQIPANFFVAGIQSDY